MAWNSLVFACMYFVLNSSVISFPEIAETFDSNQDWKSAMTKIEELQNIVRSQEDRISSLEKNTKESTEQVVELQRTLNKQSDRITQLETRVIELEAMLKEEMESIAIHPMEQESDSVQPTDMSNTRNSVFRISNRGGGGNNFYDTVFKPPRVCNSYADDGPWFEMMVTTKERLTNIQSRSVPVEPVAFYAYLSTHEAASSAIHHIIAFDKVITNVGNAYHPHTGTFIAPRSGLYIFTWTIAQWGTSYHVTELVVDNEIVNVIYMNPANVMAGGVTGTVVVHVNQGDDVFVRTGSRNNHGEIISDTDSRSTFAGWNIL